MQEGLPGFVLNSETLPRKAMNETPSTPTNLTAEEPQAQRSGLSDERLMLAFTQGSSEAFSELFHRHRQPVYGFFCRRVSDPANAEELTEETFFALLRSATRYEPRAPFRVTAARNRSELLPEPEHSVEMWKIHRRQPG